MVDLVNTCPKEHMVTFVPIKMLLDRHEMVIKTYSLYCKILELVVGFAMSPRFKKTDHQSPSYNCFSEGVSLGERRLPHAKSKAKLRSPLLFPYF